ncbi:lytic polysaccharide monooxygenase auxiliary activity family 9 protein [Streptomyces sp. NPDC048483]|uniref:lytic polysaccharide monooxygenase auxiliary activity family 9 protein n=1 Tax=Streptomyces sp. NPDC048483 TaxID=3154927 RepID=UPI003425A2AF
MEARHGQVSSPPSRAQLYLAAWQAAGLEAGKFFPASDSGLRDPYAPDDTMNGQPPEDGRIASAGHDFAALLDEPRNDWKTQSVSSGQRLDIAWYSGTAHRTRRWNYFLTKEGWDPGERLSRGQFEAEPFHAEQLTCQPFWSCDSLIPEEPTTHTLLMPRRADGYQVLLAVWEIADTPNAFYQVIDLEYT